AILNTQYSQEANTANSSTWVKTDGNKLILMEEAGFMDIASANPV
ncbi:9861_t:CDS:1, partial [Ambispora gerdemannii]